MVTSIIQFFDSIVLTLVYACYLAKCEQGELDPFEGPLV